MFEPAGHRSADNYTVERGKKRKKKKENFSAREGKTNLENDKWNSLFSETVSSLRDGAVITEFLLWVLFSAGDAPSLAKNPLCINYRLWMHAN